MASAGLPDLPIGLACTACGQPITVSYMAHGSDAAVLISDTILELVKAAAVAAITQRGVCAPSYAAPVARQARHNASMTTTFQPPYKLGKAARMEDPRNLKLAHYVNLSRLPSPPADVDFTEAIASATGFPMYANDRCGDCVFATAGHMTEIWTALGGTQVTPAEEEVVAMYAAVTGFNPATGANDNGAVELDALNWWRKNPLHGQQILAHVEVDPNNPEMLQVGHWLFGGLFYGFNMPQAWQAQVGPGKSWGPPTDSQGKPAKADGIWTPGTWGGHAINSARAYLAHDELWVVTWAMLQHVEAKALPVYCDEAHAVLPVDWQTHFPPDALRGGFDFDKLQAALSEFGPLNQ